MCAGRRPATRNPQLTKAQSCTHQQASTRPRRHPSLLPVDYVHCSLLAPWSISRCCLNLLPNCNCLVGPNPRLSCCGQWLIGQSPMPRSASLVSATAPRSCVWIMANSLLEPWSLSNYCVGLLFKCDCPLGRPPLALAFGCRAMTDAPIGCARLGHHPYLLPSDDGYYSVFEL